MSPIRVAAAVLVTLLAAGAAQAQVWEYKSYKKKGQGGQYDKEVFTMGTVELEEKDGKATLRFVAGTMDICRKGDQPATVSRTDATTTIEPAVSLSGCEKYRLVIKNDGSGGHREVWRNEAWKDTGWEHGLTPKK